MSCDAPIETVRLQHLSGPHPLRDKTLELLTRTVEERARVPVALDGDGDATVLPGSTILRRGT